MSWKKEIDELKKREKLAEEMGGAEKLKKQKENNRLNIRERIEKLLDDNSFHEIGKIAGNAQYNKSGDLENFTPANFIVGRGKINKKNVVIGGDDFTVRGGAADASIREKQIMAEQMANELQLPLIRLIEGTGGGGSVKSIDTDSRTYIPANPGWEWVIDNLSTVPVIALGLGPVAGLGAARLVTSHFSIMVENVSQLFVAGPPVVKRLGQDLTKEELGGSEIHKLNGVTDNVADSEEDAFLQIKSFLSYLPQNIYELSEKVDCNDPIDRKEEELLSIIPKDRKRSYEMRDIVKLVFDKDSFFEMTKFFGKGIITGFARINGFPVAIFANDSNFYAGSMSAEGAQKTSRFIRLCDTFRIPIVSLVDEPGFLIGPDAERAGTILHGTEAVLATTESKVPWTTIMIRKSFGVAAAAHYGPDGYVIAWPSAESGPLPLEGGVAVAFKKEIASAKNPEAKRKELEEKMAKNQSPFPRAEAFSVHEIIDPRETRKYIALWAERIQSQLKASLMNR